MILDFNLSYTVFANYTVQTTSTFYNSNDAVELRREIVDVRPEIVDVCILP